MISDLKKEYIKREGVRKRKRIIIVAIPLGIIILILAFVSILSRPKATCFDDKWNGNEEGIDCGGDCIPCEIKFATELEISSTQILPVEMANGISQGIFRIKNNNDNLGAKFRYEINLRGSLDENLGSFSGQSFIYPSTIKYLIESKIDLPAVDIKRAEVDIFEVEWFKTDLKPTKLFSVSDVKMEEITDASQLGYLKVLGKISNQTARDFSRVEVVVVVYSKTGQLLNVANTSIIGLQSSEIQNFQFVWLKQFPGIEQVDFSRIEIYPDALVE